MDYKIKLLCFSFFIVFVSNYSIDRLESFVETKIKNYNSYKEVIENVEGLTLLPFRNDTRASHWFYLIIVDKEKYGVARDGLLRKLNDNKI